MERSTTLTPIGLADYLHILRRRRLVVILTVIVALGVGAGLTFISDEVYAASTVMRVRDSAAVFVDSSDVRAFTDTPQRRLNNAAAELESEDFKLDVLEEVGVVRTLVNGVGASVDPQADLITIKVRSASPAAARDVANGYAELFLERRKEEMSAGMRASSEVLRENAAELAGQLEAIDNALREAAIANLPTESLQAQRVTIASQYAEFLTRADQLDVNAEFVDTESSIIAQAQLPDSPVEPTPIRNMAVGGVLGLLAGLGLAFLVDVLDDRLKTVAEIRRVIGTTPLLATIPKVGELSAGIRDHVPVIDHPHGLAAEAFRSLRTSLQFANVDDDPRAIMVTSSMPGEGKTTVAANLGATFAQKNRRVLLLDCDLRRPMLHTPFGLDLSNAPGLSAVLAGDIPLSKALLEVEFADGNRLWLLPFGARVSDPGELLASPRLDQLIAAVRSAFDVVIIDTPPVVPVADALPLARSVDEVMLVVGHRGTRRHLLARALELLARANAKHVSAVVSKAVHDGYGYGYYTYYPADEDEERGLMRRIGSSLLPSRSSRRAATNGDGSKPEDEPVAPELPAGSVESATEEP